MGVGPFQAGHKLSVGEMNEIARAVAKIVRLSGDKFIQVTHTADGTTLRLATEDLGAYLPKTRRGRWARLTAWNESDNTYSWTRLQDDGATEYVPAETGALNAKEVNGVEGIPVGAAGIGKVVWLERARPADPADPDEWRFASAKGFGLAGGPAEGLTVRYTIEGNGTVTVSEADWRRGVIWASLVGVNAESAGAADQYPGLWDGGTFWKTAFSGAALFPGLYDLINEQIGGGATVRLYVDDTDSGALKLKVTNYAFVQHVVLGLIRFDTRMASDAGTIG